MAAPLADGRELLLGRMPVPKLLETDQGGSQVCRGWGWGWANTLLLYIIYPMSGLPGHIN